jgi:hypothetical protein
MGMGEIKAFIEWMAKEGRVIWDAPVTFGLAVLLVVGICAKVFSFLYRHQIKNLTETTNNQRSVINLVEKERDGYKAEAENYIKEIEKFQTTPVPRAALPIMHGNNAIGFAFGQVTSAPTHTVTIKGAPKSSNDYEKIAAFMRLQELGLVKIEYPKMGTTVVTSTSAALPVQPFVSGDGGSTSKSS